MGETGRWFKTTFPDTPPSAITAHTAYDDEDKSSVWYCTKYYRINLYGDRGAFRIRDIHLFTANYPDIYDSTVCTENHATYEALPFIDGMRYTGKGVLAGGYITYQYGTQPHHTEMVFSDDGNGRATVNYGDLTIKLYENDPSITAPQPFTLKNRIGIDGGHLPKVVKSTEKRLTYEYGGVRYCVRARCGSIEHSGALRSEGNTLELVFDVTE